MRFIGHYYHSIEQKGRIAVPVNFRNELGETAILTRGLDGCLFLFGVEDWEEVVKEANIQPFRKKNAREWVRLLTHNAVQVSFDSQGRILIPEHLKLYAQLQKECVIAGSLNKIEIWQKGKYHQYMEELEANAEDIAENIAL